MERMQDSSLVNLVSTLTPPVGYLLACSAFPGSARGARRSREPAAPCLGVRQRTLVVHQRTAWRRRPATLSSLRRRVVFHEPVSGRRERFLSDGFSWVLQWPTARAARRPRRAPRSAVNLRAGELRSNYAILALPTSWRCGAARPQHDWNTLYKVKEKLEDVVGSSEIVRHAGIGWEAGIRTPIPWSRAM